MYTQLQYLTNIQSKAGERRGGGRGTISLWQRGPAALGSVVRTVCTTEYPTYTGIPSQANAQTKCFRWSLARAGGVVGQKPKGTVL